MGGEISTEEVIPAQIETRSRSTGVCTADGRGAHRCGDRGNVVGRKVSAPWKVHFPRIRGLSRKWRGERPIVPVELSW